MAYFLLNHKIVYHSSSYIWISRSRKVTQHWEGDRGSKNLVRSNTFVDYCYVITRHIQDGALQVTKEATWKCSCHILTGNWTIKTAIIFEFLGKSFRNLEKRFLDRTFPLIIWKKLRSVQFKRKQQKWETFKRSKVRIMYTVQYMSPYIT